MDGAAAEQQWPGRYRAGGGRWCSGGLSERLIWDDVTPGRLWNSTVVTTHHDRRHGTRCCLAVHAQPAEGYAVFPDDGRGWRRSKCAPSGLDE